MLNGYLWSLKIHLNNCYGDTPTEISLGEAIIALAEVTRLVGAWAEEETKPLHSAGVQSITSMRQSEKQPGVYTGQLTRLDYEAAREFADELHKWAAGHFR